jgi:hypothetical protein
MLPEEKERLLSLLTDEQRWCQEAEARDASGVAVRYDDDGAVAWDITGAMCRLFGWRRACELFTQLDRHIRGRRPPPRWPLLDAHIRAMAALQDFNDRVDTTFEGVRSQIESMPVGRGGAQSSRSGNGRSNASTESGAP